MSKETYKGRATGTLYCKGCDREPDQCVCEKADVKKLRGFNHPWHLAHQYELSKFPFVDWRYLVQYKRPYSTGSRGDYMANKWVTHYEPGEYDFALLHLDQQCIEPALMERGKGTLYVQLNKLIQDIPKIVLMHGTPYYPEKFSRDEIIEKVRNLVGDNTMVVNSNQAAKDFGFGTPIIHGLDPDEWWDLPKEPRSVTFVSPGGLDKYYDRQFFEAIRDELLERGIYHCHISVSWKATDRVGDPWDNYREFLGRSLIYISPMKDSPMPRARTEAMLSGCCVITTPWQDADTFIEDGVNGFICPRNPKWVADKVEWLMAHYEKAVEIGQAGRETAKEIFSVERYQADWKRLLEEVTGKKV